MVFLHRHPVPLAAAVSLTRLWCVVVPRQLVQLPKPVVVFASELRVRLPRPLVVAGQCRNCSLLALQLHSPAAGLSLTRVRVAGAVAFCDTAAGRVAGSGSLLTSIAVATPFPLASAALAVHPVAALVRALGFCVSSGGSWGGSSILCPYPDTLTPLEQSPLGLPVRGTGLGGFAAALSQAPTGRGFAFCLCQDVFVATVEFAA